MQVKNLNSNKGISKNNAMNKYKFITPWLALNQNNYKYYHNGSTCEKRKLLENVMAANILSLCKSIGLFVSVDICLGDG